MPRTKYRTLRSVFLATDLKTPDLEAHWSQVILRSSLITGSLLYSQTPVCIRSKLRVIFQARRTKKWRNISSACSTLSGWRAEGGSTIVVPCSKPLEFEHSNTASASPSPQSCTRPMSMRYDIKPLSPSEAFCDASQTCKLCEYRCHALLKGISREIAFHRVLDWR